MKPVLADAEARQRIRSDLATTLVVEAAAGTGKTTELVSRIVALVSSGAARLSRIVAVTFTEKAAGEMKLRVHALVEAERQRAAPTERARLEQALAELEVAHIGTIHGFCTEILRERPVEARVDPMFEVAADEARERLFGEAFESWFQKMLADPPEGVRRVLSRPNRDRDGGGPRGALRKAGLDLVDQRDFEGSYRRDPFDREATFDAVIEKLSALRDYVGRANKPDDYLAKNIENIARFVDELIRREAVRAGRGSQPGAGTDSGRDHDGLEAELRALVGKKTGWHWIGYGPQFGKGLARADVAQARNAAKVELDLALANADADLAACLREELRPLVAAYEQLKAKAGQIDFLDLLVKTRDPLRDDPAVRGELSARFSHLLVDEFQDTDPLQAEIVLLLASEGATESDWTKVRVHPGKLFVVGDPKQSIYRFRRADVALYESIKRRLAADGAAVLYLSTSFRSATAIQRLVNAAFAPLMQGGDDGSQATYVPLSPFRDDPTDRPSVVALPVPRPYSSFGKVTNFAIDLSLPDAVGAFVHYLVNESGWTISERERPDVLVPIRPRHICLLFKRFSSFGEDVTKPYVRALEGRSIPHVLVGGRSYHAREEVIALRSALQAIEWPDDELSVYATLRGAFFALSDDALLAYHHEHKTLSPFAVVDEAKLSPARRDVHDALAVLAGLHRKRNRRPIAQTLSELLAVTRAHAGVAIWNAGEQSLANLFRMLDLARRFETSAPTSFRAFVERLDEDHERRGAAEAPVVEEGTEGVRMMTVHRSKGLEFPVVILADPTAPPMHEKPSRYVDPSRGLWAMPLAGASPVELRERALEVLQRDRDEAVRLTYVATTRAREILVIPVCGDEPIDGWLAALNPVIHPPAADRQRPDEGAGCPAFGDDSVFERPATFRGSPNPVVRPGLHHGEVGAVPVVWWDPFVLGLDREPSAGLRQEKLLAADESGALANEGERAHDAWKTARDLLITQGKTESVRVVSVTAHSAAATGATAVARDEVPTRLSSRPRGPRFGTLVHAVLAEIAWGAEEPQVLELARLFGRQLGATAREIDAGANACVDALTHPLLIRAAASDACRREMPMSVVEADGALVEGVIDLAFREVLDGAPRWTIVDYKTDIGGPPPGGKYDAQVGVYVRAVERATGEKASGVLLFV